MENKFNDALFLVKASKLSIEDAFMKNLPKTENERDLMINLAVTMQGAKDFVCFKRQTFVDGVGMILGYDIIPGHIKYASYNDWNNIARWWDNGTNARISSKKEYTLLLGVLIKELVKSGWSVEDAWDAVCNNSKRLFDAKELTGDLAILINIIKSPKMLKPTFHENVSDIAFYVAKTDTNLYDFSSVTYEKSEYDLVIDMYFRDYTPPATGNPYQDELDKLSREVKDVKSEKREEIAWIVMDAN